MRILDSIKENWRIYLIALILILNVLAPLEPVAKYIPLKASLITSFLSIAYILFDMLEKKDANREMIEVKAKLEKSNQSLETLKTYAEEADKELQESKNLREKKQERGKLVAKLINDNVISFETLDKQIKNKRFISVLVYGTGKTTETSKKMPKVKRLHKTILDNLGMVELCYPWGYYIISEDNLIPKKYRQLDKLAEYLLKKCKLALNEEWKSILEFNKKNSKRMYKRQKNLGNPLGITFLITKTDRRDMIHEFIKENGFNKEFNQELASLIPLKDFKLSEDEKIAIHNFVFKSSLYILLPDTEVPATDKEKLMSLEKVFKEPQNKGGLGISFFYEYHKKHRSDVENIVKTKFKKQELIDKYTDMIIENSEKFEKDLKSLGVNLS